MHKVTNFIDNISRNVGKSISFLVLPLIAVITYSVFMRYVLSMPPDWSFEVSLFLFGSCMLLGGSYCLLEGSHVNVDVLPKRLPPLGQTIIKLISNLTVLFVGSVIFYLGTNAAIRSTKILERSIHQTNFNPPIWWFRWIIPISALLLVLQAFSELIKTIKPLDKKEDKQ